MIVVTGASGHLGTVLVRQLAAEGEEIRYLTRGGPAPGLVDLEVQPVRGDLSDVESLTAACAGATVVINSAAHISIMAGDESELYRVNVEGTRNMLIAARRAGVKRFVQIGSIEAFPLEGARTPITEDDGFYPDRTVLEYGRTKALGMQEVLAAADGELECVICCPTAFIGPPDYRRSPVGQVVLDFINRRLPAYVDGGFDFVDVRDVAHGIIAAMRTAPSRSVYLLSGRFVTIPEMMEMLERLSGARRPRLCLSYGFQRPFMPLVETYYRLCGRPLRFTRERLILLHLGVQVDS